MRNNGKRPLTIQIEMAQAEALERMAARKDRSVSYLIRQAVKDMLDSEGVSVSITLGRNTRRAQHNQASEALR